MSSLTFRDLESADDVAVVFVNSYGKITSVNREFELLFGWSSVEIIGKPLTTIIAPSLREAHVAGFARLLKTGQPRLLNKPIRLKAIDKLGKEFMAEHLILGEVKNGQWFFGATICKVL